MIGSPLHGVSVGGYKLQHDGAFVSTSQGNVTIQKYQDGVNPGNSTIVKLAGGQPPESMTCGPPIPVCPNTTIGSLVKAAGGDYKLQSDNCQDATKRMAEHATRCRANP